LYRFLRATLFCLGAGLPLLGQNYTISTQRNLNLGEITSGSTSGTIQITAASAGTLIPAGGVTIVSSAAAASGDIRVTNTSILPNILNTFCVNPTGAGLAGPGGTLGVTAWNISPTTLTLIGLGAFQDFFIGMTVTVPANTQAGTYTGTFNAQTQNAPCGGGAKFYSFTATLLIDPIITMTDNRDMNFGLVAVQGAPGTCKLTAASATVSTATGGVKLVTGAPAAASAQVTATGPSGQSFSLSFTSGSMTGPGTAIPVDTFTHNSTLTLTGGTNTFFVGATAHLNFPQTAGTYTGSFTITATIP